MQQDHQNPNLESPGAARRPAAGEDRKLLRIEDILFVLRKRLLLIVICTVVGLVIGVVLGFVSYLKGEMSKQYRITTSIAVTSQNANGLFTSSSQNPTSTDVHLAEDMVDAVIYVIRSDRTLNAAVDKLSLIGVSTRDIYNNLKVNQYNTTQIIELNLYWRSAQEGIAILTAINSVLPDILISTLKIGSVSVINEPNSKYIIGGSLNASVWVYMAILGAFMGMGVAVLELLIHPTLLNTHDVENQLGMELLGEIPERKAYFRKRRNLLYQSEDETPDPIVTDNYAAIAHILQKRLRSIPHACLYATSTSQNEGKTTVIAYLAVHLSDLGMKVLLIDLDTRNPRLGGLFLSRVDYSHSLNALYRGDTDAQEAVTHLTGTLDLLPMVLEGKPLPLDDALCGMIQSMKQDYDVVLIDTAPVGQVADTLSLNRIVNAALFIIRFDGADMGRIRESLMRIDKSGMPILGCIVNGVKSLSAVRKNSYYGYGDHYHGNSSDSRRKSKAKSTLERQWEEWERASKDAKSAPGQPLGEEDQAAPDEEQPSGQAKSPEQAELPRETEPSGQAESPEQAELPQQTEPSGQTEPPMQSPSGAGTKENHE